MVDILCLKAAENHITDLLLPLLFVHTMVTKHAQVKQPPAIGRALTSDHTRNICNRGNPDYLQMSSDRVGRRPKRLGSSSVSSTKASGLTSQGNKGRERGRPRNKSRADPGVASLDQTVRKESSSRLPEFDMKALCLGQTVCAYSTEPDGVLTEFIVLREIICARPPWFRETCNRLEGGGRDLRAPRAPTFWSRILLTGSTEMVVVAEASDEAGSEPRPVPKLSITLPEIGRDVFSCFFCWVYDNSSLRLTSAPKTQPGWDCNDPTTWSYEFLFAVYFCGVQTSCPDFRHLVLEAVWLKSTIVSPQVYGLAKPAEVQKVCERLSRSDPLRRLLVFINLNMNLWPLLDQRQAEYHDGFPPTFVSDCLAQALRQKEALECEHCGLDGDSLPCKIDTHIPDDAALIRGYGWCNFHSHQSSKERQSCRWYRRTLDDI